MLELALLGPVEARSNGRHIPLAPLERNVLALLGLAEGSVLSTERIIDSLWDIRLPAAPRSRVQGLVSSLRRKIGDALVTRNPGYLLAIPDGACDLRRCEDLVRQAAGAATAAEKSRLLREALGLWHGQPLDGVSAPGIEADRVRLTELRIALLEDCVEAELALGRHAELVRELQPAVTANPLRERLTGQLMLALYRSNRQAEALRAYQVLRERLAEELGSDPCADLRELHATILRGEQRTPTEATLIDVGRLVEEHRPAQMPASVGHFLGRDADLDALTAALPGPRDEPRVLLVSGAGGLGKTALAVHWAHAVADRFPDGQIFVDLHGSAPDAVLPPGAALGAILLALGVPADQLPVHVEERAALYRTRVHGHRVLIVADDAGSVAQLLPLVPPTAGSVIVATSRSRLTALAAHHAVRVLTIQPLNPAASRDVLRAIVGPERLRGEGVAAVVGLCGGWPLTLRLAGATLAARSTQSLTSFAEELRERADVLSVAEDPRTVRAALTQAHAGLDPAAGRLFGQLGLLPGGSVSLHLVAAAAGISVLRARRLLDELISANLVLETGQDRYWFHDMVRRYARQCGAALSDREVIEERAARWYVGTFDRIARLIAPDEEWPPAGAPDEWLPFKREAVSGFVAAESPHLPAVVRWLARRRDPGLTATFVSQAYAVCPTLGAEACELGLVAAKQVGDQRTLGRAHAQLGTVLLLDSARVDAAGAHLTLAVQLLGGRRSALARTAVFGLGTVLAHQDRPAEARSMLARAVDLLDPGREPLACAVALFAHAEMLVRAGSVDGGQERFAQALILSEAAAGTRFSQGRLFLSPQVGEEFLVYLGDSLEAPRVTDPDRRLARTLLDLSLALRTGASGAVPAMRMAGAATTAGQLPRRGG